MSRSALRLCELVAISMIAIVALGVAAFMLWLNRTGDAFGVVIGVVPLCISAIGRLGQSSAMQSMADHLASSAPVGPNEN